MTHEPRTRWPDGGPEDERALELFGASSDGAAACPPPEIVQASLAGTLPPQIQERIATHVADCGICGALITALEDESVSSVTPEEKERILGRVRAGITLHRRKALHRRIWRWSAAAALIVLAGAGVLWFRRDTPPPAFQLTAQELLLLKQTGQRDFMPANLDERAELAEALAPFDTEDFREARKRLEDLVTRRPASIAANFYFGVTNLHVGRHYTGVPALEFAQRAARTDMPSLAQSAEWYLAMGYVATAELDRGRALLAMICENSGEFASRACNGLEELEVPIRFTGIVTGPNGEPLAGVRVGQLLLRTEDIYMVSDPTRLSAITDAAGRYTVVGPPLALGRPAIIRAAKPGYFSRGVLMDLPRESPADFSLVPWTLIPLGETIKSTIEADDMKCAPDRCHEYALAVPATGTLEVSVEAPVRNRMDLYVETPTGEVYGLQQDAPMRVALPTVAGSTFQILVMSFTAEPRQYSLTTRMR